MADTTSATCATLYTGARMPLVGLGTWKSKPGQVSNAVYHALANGYKHIDCAAVYGNEKEVGEGLAKAFSEGICTREEIFVTSKLWNSSHHPDDVVPALQETLTDLGLEYLDLYLIHWPTNFLRGQGTKFPKDPEGKMLYGTTDYNFEKTWPVLEQCVDNNQVRAIGLSNFNTQQIDRVRNLATKHQPAVLQVECNPYCTQDVLKSYCDSNNIVMTAYSPLGSPDRPWASPEDPSILQDPKVAEVAQKYGKSNAQVLIRFQVDRGIVVIPKSVTPSRIEQNIDVNFKLSDEDMEVLKSYNRNWRSCVPQITVNDKLVARDQEHPEFPFGVDEELVF